MYETPILLLVFNRPDHAQVLFNRVRELKPKQLFINADGARPNKPDEKEKCEATRAIFEQIDWDCEVFRLFHEENVGLRKSVTGGITWFFEYVEYGIILEDDCIPDFTFFRFCSEILEKYKNEEKIFQIGGSNLIFEKFNHLNESYIFSKFVPIWGWATWRRAWKKMDVNLKDLDRFKEENKINDFVYVKPAQDYMLQKFEDTYHKRNQSWAYAWFYSVLLNDGYSIIPTQNLVHNIGFGDASTHTNKAMKRSAMKASSLSFPLVHPQKIESNKAINQAYFYVSQKEKWLLYINALVPKWIMNILRKILGIK